MKSGQLYLTKTDRRNIEVVLAHCETDLSYEGGGTFNLGDVDNSADIKEIEKARDGVDGIRWILEVLK